MEKFKEFIKKNKKSLISFIMFFITILSVFGYYLVDTKIEDSNEIIAYSTFINEVENGNVEKVNIDFTEEHFTYKMVNGEEYKTSNPNVDNFKEYLLLSDVVVEEEESNTSSIITLLPFMFYFIFFIFLIKRMVPNGSTKKLLKNIPDVDFDDIAGNTEVKKEMQFIVDFLKNAEDIKKAGARMPKGIVLYGPPGTGKTLLAKAIAGTADVPFYSVSGSDFIEMYVGLGAKRVRELFKEAKKNAPCIVFIDEIDSIGGKRGGTKTHSENEQTINSLLAELDGFEDNGGIITMCATNRIEDLDDALIRSGRFDRQIAVPLPDKKSRYDILQVYTKNKKFDESVDLKYIADSSVNFSGADIEALVNEAALEAAMRKSEIISEEDFEKASFKLTMKGNQKENNTRNKETLRLVAWHEAGHALATKLLTKDEVSKVTILESTSGAGGFTATTPREDGLYSKEYLETLIQVMYAGRAAEQLLYNGDTSKITVGASNDIIKATSIIKSYISDYGMNDEIGMISLREFNKNSINEVPSAALELASKMSKVEYNNVLNLLEKNIHILETIANKLLEDETIKEDELDKIIKGGMKDE